MRDDVTVVSTEWFTRDFFSLPVDHRKRVSSRLRMLERKGWAASIAAADVIELDDGIWEMRVLGHGPAFRILFFLDPRAPARIVVLTACVPKASIKGARVMTAEIQRAKARRAQWLQEAP